MRIKVTSAQELALSQVDGARDLIHKLANVDPLVAAGTVVNLPPKESQSRRAGKTFVFEDIKADIQ